MCRNLLVKATFALALVMPAGALAVSDTHRPDSKQQRNQYDASKWPRVERTQLKMRWNGRLYRVWVSAPQGKPPEQGYPVLYVTDANGVFDTAAQAAYVQAFYSEVTGVRAGIVVGIGYDIDLPFPPERAYDLSPPDPNPPADAAVMRNEAVAGTGGADHFLDFIEQAVKPEIARRYAVNPKHQALFGHSRGGLFVLHALFTRSDAFQYYIAASPAIWWHDRFILKEAAAFSAAYARQPKPLHLMLSVGAEEGSAMAAGTGRTADGKQAVPTQTAMVANVEALARDLSTLNAKGLDVHYRSFAETNHITMLSPAIGAAVTFAFQHKK